MWFSKGGRVCGGDEDERMGHLNGERKKLWGSGTDAHTMRSFPRGRSCGLGALGVCRRSAAAGSGTNISLRRLAIIDYCLPLFGEIFTAGLPPPREKAHPVPCLCLESPLYRLAVVSPPRSMQQSHGTSSLGRP